MAEDAQQDVHQGLTRAEWPLLLVLAAVQFTHSMDFIIMMPLGPQCRQELHITPKEFALVVSAYGFSAALAGLVAAWFIDRFDRKTSLLAVYAGLTLGTLFCAVAPSYGWLLLARAVAGAFGGIVAALILVIIGDAIPELRRGRATGVVMTAFSVASIAGLPAGIFLGLRYGMGVPFGHLGLFCIAIWILAFRVLPPLRGHLGHKRQSAAETWAVLTHPIHARAYAFMTMLVIGNFTIAPHFSDFLVHNVGRDKDELKYVYFCGGLLTFVTLPLIGRFADRFGKLPVYRLMAFCSLLTVLCMSNLSTTPLPLVLIVTTLYWIFSSGRWTPAMALITSSVVPRYRGSFMSVNASVQTMAIGLASMIAGAVVGERDKNPELTAVAVTGSIAAVSAAPVIGLTAVTNGAVIGALQEKVLTGYWIAGIIGAIASVFGMALAGRLRVAQEIPETSAAVDALGDTSAI